MALRLPSLRALGWLWPRIRPHRWALAAAITCLTLSAAIGLAFPQIVRHLLDAAFVRHDRGMLDRIAVLLAGLFTIQALSNFVQTYLLSATGERVVARLRQDLFEHLVRLSPAFFAERRTGELVSRLSADIGTIQGLVSFQISEFARQSLYLVGGITLLTLTNPHLMATALVVVPFVVGSAMFFGRLLRRASTKVQDQVADATAVAEEAFSEIRIVQSFVQEAWEAARYGKSMAEVVRIAIRRAVIRGAFFAVITFATFGGTVAVLWEGGRLVLAGVVTAGTLVSFLLYTVFIAAAVAALTSLFTSYQETAGAARRVFELLQTEPTVADPPEARPLPTPVRGSVVLDHVSFRYQSELLLAVDDVSFQIAPGEVVALVGPSGAGKECAACGPAPGRGHRASGADAVQRHRGGKHRLRAADRGSSGDRRRRPRGARGRVRRPAAAGLRDARRPARHQALRRPAPAGGDRARPPQGPRRADPRRSHFEPRCRERAADRGSARAAAQGPQHADHRPPALHSAPGEPAGCTGPRTRRRGRHSRRPVGQARAVRTAVPETIQR